MEVDLTGANEGGRRFVLGQRYPLVVSEADEGVSGAFGEEEKPWIDLSFETETGEKAFGKRLFLHKKAIFFSLEWFAALGFPTEGKFTFPTDSVKGIRFSAECGEREDRNDPKKKYTDWVLPLPIKAGMPDSSGHHQPQAAAAAPARKAAPPPVDDSGVEEVPF
jgi:hypothetical protein